MNVQLKSGKAVKVSSRRGDKSADWNPSGENYKITVTVNGKRLSFDFWDSYHNMVNNIPCDERGALACFAMDASYGYDSVDEIASEFGYTKPSEAIRVFKGLQKARKQAERVGLTDDELSELSDY